MDNMISSLIKKYLKPVFLSRYIVSIFIFSLIVMPFNGYSKGSINGKTSSDTNSRIEQSKKGHSNYSNDDGQLMLLKHEVSTKRLVIIFTVVTIGGLSMFLTLLYVDTRRRRKMLVQQKIIAENEAILLKERIEVTSRELASKALFMATIDDTKVRLSDTFNKIMPFINEDGKKILHDALMEFDFKTEHDTWGGI